MPASQEHGQRTSEVRRLSLINRPLIVHSCRIHLRDLASLMVIDENYDSTQSASRLLLVCSFSPWRGPASVRMGGRWPPDHQSTRVFRVACRYSYVSSKSA